MSKIKNMKLRYKIGAGVATAGAIAGMAGGAFAFWSSSGTGSGSAATGSSAGETLTQTSTISGLAPGSPAQTIYGTVTNAKGQTEYIGTVTPSIDSAHTTWQTVGGYTCSVSDYTLAPNTVNTDEASGTTGVNFGTIVFKDSGVNQDACQNQALVLSFSSN